jgi:hypothetical protein
MQSSEAVAKRLFYEHNKLQEKIKKLRTFIDHSVVFITLPSDERVILRWQLSAMCSYRDALQMRCDRVVSEEESLDETSTRTNR